MQIIQSIQNRIYHIRNERIMLDFDLADLYDVTTKALNQAVKRNILRFPDDFMFRLTVLEWHQLRSQIVTASQNKRNSTVTPYVFTEQGVAMLSGVLNSERAIKMNIAIMRAFIEIRKILIQETDLQEQIRKIKERLGGHDAQLSQIYDALENLVNEKVAQLKWQSRVRIGFKE